MIVICIVISSLALLAATVSVIITVMERKRNQERNAAMLQYVDKSIGRAIKELGDCAQRFEADKISYMREIENQVIPRIEALENGAVPDYEKAKEAANAVNNFNAGITGILGYDPYSALQAQRDRENRGEKT